MRCSLINKGGGLGRFPLQSRHCERSEAVRTFHKKKQPLPFYRKTRVS